MKYIKNFENKILDVILDKISSNGVDSLNSIEREYLDNYSNKTDKKYQDNIGDYVAVLKINNIEREKWHGVLTLTTNNDIINYNGYILTSDDEFIYAEFTNEDSDLYSDLEGYEYDIDSFFKNAIEKLSLYENIEIPIEIDNIIYGGRFKNKKMIVKSISKDENGELLVNNKPLLKFKLNKPKTKKRKN